MNKEQQLHDTITRYAPQWIFFLKELIRIPSVVGSEAKCQDRVRRAMQDIGLFSRAIYADNTLPFHDTGRCYKDRPSLVGTIPGTGLSNAFILNAHIDTAPVENPDSWRFSPFHPTEKDGRLYGRGVLDDKAGIAMLLLLAHSFLEQGIRLTGDLHFQSVIEDEDSGNGTLACTRAGYSADAAIVIDGTWPLRIIDAHLGQISLEITIYGESAPACSINRVMHPVQVARTLLDRIDDWVARHNDGLNWEGLASPCFCNVGILRSGAWTGSVPEQCTIGIQFGFAPPYTAQDILMQFREIAAEVMPNKGLQPIGVKVGSLMTPPFANKLNPTVRLLQSNIERLGGSEGDVKNVTVSGHCDLRHIKTASGAPSAACLYGPGGGGNPHAKDEFYILDHFIPVACNIASTILQWSGVIK